MQAVISEVTGTGSGTAAAVLIEPVAESGHSSLLAVTTAVIAGATAAAFRV